MRKLFGAIFGSSKNTETIVDGAVRGLDALVFTDEEKALASAQMRDWFLKYLAATAPQNLARRLIAMTVVILWAFLVLVGVALFKLSPDYSAFIFTTLDQIVHYPFMMIMGFYFAAHVVRAWQNGKSKE